MTQLNLAPTWHEDRVVFDDLEIGEIALDLDDQEPQDVIEWALSTFGDRIAIVTAMQADGMAILDMAAKIKPDVRVITVDTGRLPQGFDLERSTNLGLSIVKTLVESELKGSLRLEQRAGGPGARATIDVPLEE